MSDVVSERARQLYDDALVWDTHSGFMPDPGADLNNLSIWRDAGVDYLSIDVGFDLLLWEHTVRTLAAFRHWILAHDDAFTLVSRTSQIRRAWHPCDVAVKASAEFRSKLPM
jgi:membrane dipeptidase